MLLLFICGKKKKPTNYFSLQISKVVPVPEQYTTVGTFTTVAFCSDGVNFYWFWCPGTIADKNVKGQTLNMDVCRVDVRVGNLKIFGRVFK